jgi:hypothetical protein
MAANDLNPVIADFLRLLANEVENNKAMGRRLSAPFIEYFNQQQEKRIQPVKTLKKKEKDLLPEGFDPFAIYYEQGSIGLLAALADKDAGTLKAILSHFALDPTRSYSKWRKQERLAAFIIQRVKAMSSKGNAFVDEE